MSKINKIRFVNLNYNNNSMKVDDETFFLDGENTMFNLRNGGGKSVLVQMVMAPFVNRRHRNIKDRTFDSYFTSPTPTYILVEWKLDDGAGYLLTGMMVRTKESSSDENSKEKLDIVNFIHEYRQRNEYDINSIPIIEEKSDRRVIKSFANSKKMFEDLKKNRDLKFNYYDMNNSVTTRSYFSKLEEYKINYKEWETIIKQINLKESGLSDLFTKAKDSNGLVKEWFLPAIENKLKKDEDRIKNYRELIDRYIKQYRANKSNIDKKVKIELFNEFSVELLEACDDFIKTIKNREEIENQIANVIVYLRRKLKAMEEEEIELTGLIEALQESIKELGYERDSIKIHKREEEIEILKETLAVNEALVLESENKKKDLKRKSNTLECAKIHREYQKKSKELQQLERQLEAVNKKNEDNAPRINNLGFTIKHILSGELETIKESKNKKLEIRRELLEEKERCKEELNKNRVSISKLKGDEGSYRAKISAFDREENRFNNEYQEELVRNISGYFDDEKLILTDKNIVNEELQLNKNKKEFGEKLLKDSERLKSNESQKLRNIELKSEVKNKLGTKMLELEKANKEIEVRKEIIKYIEFSEEKAFDTSGIIGAFENKIKFLRNDEVNFIKSHDKLVEELEKLKCGKVLELPKEIENKLKEKDIKITYGMEWLKKNGQSLEKNQEMVKNNPFIPYSLIMDSKEIEILEKEALDIFTSNPISIINRVDLEKSLNDIREDIVLLSGVRFFISFNNKLLNEAELVKLIRESELSISEINRKIKEKKESITFYEGKKNIIQYSELTLETYEQLKEDINSLTKSEEELRQGEIILIKEIGQFEDSIKRLKENINDIESCIGKNRLKSKAFKDLKSEYEKYKKDRESLERLKERLKILENLVATDEKRSENIEAELTECQEVIRSYKEVERSVEEKIAEFNIYNAGQIINRDKEDLLAEFYALTKEISSTEKELNERIIILDKEFNIAQDELNTKADKYSIKEEAYIREVYDINKELELADTLEKENRVYDDLKTKANKVNTDLAVAKSKLEGSFEKLKRDFDKDVAKDKEMLFNKEFKEEIAKLRVDIKEKEAEKSRIIKNKNCISQNLVNLNEHDNFTIEEAVEIIISIDEMNEVIGKIKRDLNSAKGSETRKENALRGLVIDLEIKDDFKEETLFKEPIQTLKGLVSKPQEFKDQLNLICNSYNLIIEKLNVDIDLIEKEETKILESILGYISEVHENIEKIDDNSSIIINNKRLKMLNITVANWEENKELYKMRLKEYIENIRNQSLDALESNEDIEDIISNKININKLYDEVVSISNVNIKLYKIEEDKQRQITWDEVSKNSGGEGFLSAFIILSSLLSYMRKDENDIFSRKEGGKVLVMDNPFAQTSSAHLLKPLMDIAKKSNTQLICLTGLGGDSIYNRFDNIYVLNLVSSKLKSGIKYLRSEHTKGEDEKEVMVASRFRIEEQIKLF